MPWVFSYAEFGPQALEGLLKKAPFCSLPATLANHHVVFRGKSRKWNGATASVEAKKGSTVFGAIHLVTSDELKLITRYYKDSYSAKQIAATLSPTGDKVQATVFVMSQEQVVGSPSDDYSKAIIKNLRFFWGQDDGKTPTLEDFGIQTLTSAVKRASIKK